MAKYVPYPYRASHRKWFGQLIREAKSSFIHLFCFSLKVNINIVGLWKAFWLRCALPVLRLHFYTLWFYFYFLVETLRQHLEHDQWSLLAPKRLYPMRQVVVSPVMISSPQEISNQHYISIRMPLHDSGESNTNTWKLNIGHNVL